MRVARTRFQVSWLSRSQRLAEMVSAARALNHFRYRDPSDLLAGVRNVRRAAHVADLHDIALGRPGAFGFGLKRQRALAGVGTAGVDVVGAHGAAEPPLAAVLEHDVEGRALPGLHVAGVNGGA